MNIALCNRPETWPGGDMVQLRGYQKALQKLGHKADYLPHPIQSKSYDEAWIFHMNFWWALNHAIAASKLSIPYKLFALYYPNLDGSISMTDMQWMIDNATDVYCLSVEEAYQLKKSGLDVNNNKFPIIDNGVDKDIFYSSSNFRDGVISVGRFLADKGHHRVIEACKKLGFPLTIAGFKCDDIYEDFCKALAEKHDVDIWSNLTQEQLALMYNQSKVIVCASSSERNNLAILEGAACGATTVDSINNMAYAHHQSFGLEKGFYVTVPSSQVDLVEKIKLAWDNPRDCSAYIKDWSDIVKDILYNG